MLQTSLLETQAKIPLLRRVKAPQQPPSHLQRDRRTPVRGTGLQRCLAKQQQQKESSETARQVSQAAETAGKVRTFLGGEGQQAASSNRNTSLPAPEDVPDRAKQAGISPLILGGAGLIALSGLGLGLTSVTPDSVSTLAESSQDMVHQSPLSEGFVSAFLLILFSELGDKTFFIAVLLALKHSKSVVFAGSFGALAVMTVISVGLGEFLHQLDDKLPNSPVPVDDVLAVVLLVFFGIQTLRDAIESTQKSDEERGEAEESVASLGGGSTSGLLLSTFALVFAAEWGDKSFLATIALSAASSPLGVVLGAVSGHGVATGIAVVGGSVLSKYLSERVLQYAGGSLFLVFAAVTIVDIFKQL
ncbi:hypothetical protein WJX74_008088 [Apatococcus lobatus]|uniref:GDT1 family protein n=1 Tax=Apatococcus lobatus TaxID=904363 RepID=A0AAW1RJM8_9CHLO